MGRTGAMRADGHHCGRPATCRFLASSSVLMLALTACDHGHAVTREPPGPHGSPTRAGECSDLPLVGSDGGMVLGTDWSTKAHPYDQPVNLTVCGTTSS